MGRPTKVTPQIKQPMIELMLQHPNFADLQIAQIVSERFACAIIDQPRHLAHFKFLPRKRCQNLIKIQRRQHYQFASDFVNGKLPTENLIFSNGSGFCMGLDNRWVWRRRGEYEEEIFAEAGKYPRISVHFWAAIGIGLKSRISNLNEQSIQMSALRR
jgi:hypothetical protein